MKTTVLTSILSLAASLALVPLAAGEDKQPDRLPGSDLPGAKDPDRTVPGDDKEAAPASESDFVSRAVQKGDAEVKVAELAVSKAHDAAVKEFAQMLVREHTSSNEELKKIAEKLSIKPAETPNAKAEEKFRELSSKTGREFDKAFIEMAGHCHEKNITFYEAGKKVAKNSEVTAYIDKTIPVLKTHATKIQSLKTGSDKSGDTTPRPGPATDPAEPEKR